MKVKFIGFGGYIDTPCYKDENGRLYFDENNGRNGLNLYTGAYRDKFGEILGEPRNFVTEPVECDAPFIRHAREHDYGMLSRLLEDCKYFLGNGNGYEGHLYYGAVNKHCDEMKNLYDSFSDEDKPEWLTAEQIEQYRNDMLTLLTQKSIPAPAPYLKDGSDITYETELAVQLGDVYIGIQECSEGYDYTIYRMDYSEIDGGVYDNPDISIREALKEIVDDISGSPEYTADETTQMNELDFDDLMQKVAEKEALIIPRKRGR